MSQATPLRLLIVEDCRADAELCVRELECGGFGVEWDLVDQPTTLLAALACARYDLVLLDFGLPGWSGSAALQLLRETAPDTPIILVTGSLGDEMAVDCIHAGASDYVLKENLVRLAPAVRRTLDAHALRRARREAEEALVRAHAELERHVAERTADLARLNQELSAARAEWEQIFDCMSDAVTYHDPQYNILRANRAFRKLFPEAVLHASCFRIFHGTDHPIDACPLARTLVTRQSETSEIYEPLLRRHLLVRTDPVKGQDGNIVRVVHVVTDITQRKLDEELQERLADILQATTGMALTADRAGSIVFLNRAGHRMLALPEDVPPPSLGDFYPGWMTNLEEGGPPGTNAWVQETALRRSDGSEFPVLLITVVHRREGTDGSLFSLVAHDITHRKMIERMKDELVSTVSHELRTPLASMIGFTELLLNRTYDEQKRREFLGVVHAECQRLADLINNFLDLQRIESGRQVYNMEPCDLAPMLRDCVAVFQAANESHSFALEIPENLPAVTVDAARMRQVATNLLSNAVKYSPDGGVVRVGARAEAGRILFWVADQGIGLAPEDVPRLFTRFFRGENAARRAIRGSGLGLALCREILRSMDGQIWAESASGHGTVFHVALPLVAHNVRAAAVEPAALAP